ncbi:Nuclear fusion protein KAR5 [Elsinoe australis]|uniref:Nuclear fusion protein KAR5 n=1 Tax=Elsinoe australis TaxID=40998 RepID=A0A2P8A2Y7_9PEZI|nr:Nuclear fusion protein KAR5 [Elsinoe australis]
MASMLMKLAVFITLFSLANAGIFGGNAALTAVRVKDTPVKNSVDAIVDIHSMPPCNKIATAQLIQSCDALERDSDSVFEGLRSKYAVRLAICEITGAGLSAPKACSKLVPSPDMVRKVTVKGAFKNGLLTSPTFAYPKYDDMPDGQFQGCLNSLSATSQFWTSYSNNLQNAVTICKSKKMDLMVEGLYSASEHLQELFSNTSDKLKDFSEHLNEAHSSTTEWQNDLGEAIRRMSDQVNKTSSAAVSAVDSLAPIQDVSVNIGSIAAQMIEVNDLVKNAIATLRDTDLELGFAGRDVVALRSSLEHLDHQHKVLFGGIADGLQKINESLDSLPDRIHRQVDIGLESIPAHIISNVSRYLLSWVYLPTIAGLCASVSLVVIYLLRRYQLNFGLKVQWGLQLIDRYTRELIYQKMSVATYNNSNEDHPTLQNGDQHLTAEDDEATINEQFSDDDASIATEQSNENSTSMTPQPSVDNPVLSRRVDEDMALRPVSTRKLQSSVSSTKLLCQ